MANKEIADLTDAGTLDGTESLHVVKSGNSLKTAAAAVSRSGLGAVDVDIIPDTDSARDLGDATKAWALAYLDEIRGVGSETLVRRSGGTNATPIVEGLAKVWANLNGTGTIALRDSLNIASVTDNGAGDYSLDISNDMANANYMISCNASFDSGGFTGQQNAQPKADFTPTTGVYRIATSNSSNSTLVDSQKVYSLIKGDLA